MDIMMIDLMLFIFLPDVVVAAEEYDLLLVGMNKR
jgi:hypothetical protein